MADQVDDYVKRPLRYQNIDELNELGAGIGWTGLMLLLLFRDIAPSGSIWHHRSTFPVGVVVLLLVVRYFHRVLKKRITHPRTGYVKYRQSRAKVIAGLLAGIAGASATWLIVRGFEHHSFEIAGIALASAAWALTYATLTRMDAAWRWVVLVALIAAPPVVAMLPLGPSWRDHLPFVMQGLIFAVSGAIGLALYLHRNPLPQEDAE